MDRFDSPIIVLQNPTTSGTLEYIRRNFDDIVSGKKNRVLVIIHGDLLRNEGGALLMRDLALHHGFNLHTSAVRYVIMEKVFRPPSTV
jgi:hypothetical protein